MQSVGRGVYDSRSKTIEAGIGLVSKVDFGDSLEMTLQENAAVAG